MAITGTRTMTLAFTGDIVGTLSPNPSAINTNSSAVEQIVTLASGANTITPPGSGPVPESVTIVPPAGNTTSIIVKGVTGDTGVRLHNTNPTTIAIDSSVVNFVLTAGGSIASVKLIWN